MMRVSRWKESGAWLPPVALLAVTLVAMLLLAEAPAVSQDGGAAAAPGEARLLQAPAPDSQPAQNSIVRLPLVSRNFEYAHFVVESRVAPQAVTAGTEAEVVYTVVISNAGDTPAAVLAVSDTLPAGLSFVAMAAGSDVLTNPSGTSPLVWQGDWSLAPGQQLDLMYRARANVAVGSYANRVVVAARGALVPRQPAVAVLVADQPLAGLTAGNDGPTMQGQPTTLTAGVTAGSNVVYTWAFGDNTTGTGGSTTHVYPASGTYTATVTARNGVSQQSASTVVTIQPGVLFEEHFDDPSVRLSRWTRFLNYWRLEEDQWVWEATDGVGGSGAATQDCWLGGKKVAEDALLMYLGPGATSWTDYRVETKMLLRGGVTEKDGALVVTEAGGYPLGLWVRGQYQDVGDSDTAGWVTGYYIIVGGKPANDTMFIRLSQLQTTTDCWDQACQNPQNLYDFNNPHQLREVTLQRTFARKVWYSLAVEVRGANIKVFWENQLVIDYTDTKEPFLTGTIGLKTYKSKTASYDDVKVTPLE